MPVEPLVRAEEEGAVAPQGAAERRPGLGARVGGLLRVEEVAGLDVAVAQEAEHIAVEPVAAAARDDVHGAAAGPAELGAGGVAVDLELLHRLLADAHAHAAGVDIVLHAIQEEAVAAAVAAAEADAGLRRLRHAVVGAVGEILRGGGGGRQQREVEIVAPVDRQLRDARQIDCRRLLGALGIYHRRFRQHLDDLLQFAHFHADRQREHFAHAHLDALEDLRREALRLDAHAVAARRQQREDKFAGLAGFGGALDGSLRVLRLELRAADHGAACVGDDAADLARIALRLWICWKAGDGRNGPQRHRLHRATPRLLSCKGRLSGF